VAVGDERGERVEDIGVALGHAAELHPRVVGGVAEAVLELLFARLGVELVAVWQDGYADEVDEVAGDDDAPTMACRACTPVVIEELDEVVIHAPRSLAEPRRLLVIVEVTSEVDVRQDEEALRIALHVVRKQRRGLHTINVRHALRFSKAAAPRMVKS
jgi:hypothetical protein